MRQFFEMLQRRFKTGAWSRFSLSRLGYHIAIWAIFIWFYMLNRGAESENVMYASAAVGALLLHIALANHMCRSFKELALVVAVMLAPGLLMANRLILLAPSDYFPVGKCLMCNYRIVVAFSFLGMLLLVFALRLPDVFAKSDQTASAQRALKSNRSQAYRVAFRLTLHVVAWIGVGGFLFALGDLKSMGTLVAFVILLEIFAWIGPTFECLIGFVVLLQLGVAAFQMFSAEGSGGSMNLLHAMLWPRLQFSGWILLVWLLSLSETQRSFGPHGWRLLK